MLPALAIAGAGSAVKLLTGAFQAFKGRKMLKDLKRPGYEIPDEFNQNVGIAKDIKNMGGLTRESFAKASQNIGRNMAAGMQGLRGRGGAVAGVSNIVQSANDSATDLAVADADRRQNNFRLGSQLQMNALNAVASQKLARQNWEKFLPFQERRAEAQALIGAGMQNAMGALGDMSSLAVSDMMWNEGKGFGGGMSGTKTPLSTGSARTMAPVSFSRLNFLDKNPVIMGNRRPTLRQDYIFGGDQSAGFTYPE